MSPADESELPASLKKAVEALRTDLPTEPQVLSLTEKVMQSVLANKGRVEPVPPASSGLSPANWKLLTTVAAVVLPLFIAGLIYLMNLKPNQAILSNATAPEAKTHGKPMLFEFRPGIHSIAYQRPGSNDPTDLLVVAEGPRESVRLGQAFTKAIIPVGEPRYIHLFDPRASPQSKVLTKQPVPGFFVLTPDRKSVLLTSGQIIHLDTEATTQLSGDWNAVRLVRFATDNRLLKVRLAADGQNDRCDVEVVNFPKMETMKTLIDINTGIFQGEWMPGKQLCATVFVDGEIHVTEVEKYKQTTVLKEKVAGEVVEIRMSSDAKWIASAHAQGTLLLHDHSTGMLKTRISPIAHFPPRTISFSPDNKLLAVANAQQILLYETESGKLVQQFPNESSSCSQLFWSADGKTITALHGSYSRTEADGAESFHYPSLNKWVVTGGAK